MCPRLAYSGSPIRWKSMDALKALYPDSLELLGLSDETRVVVSEPFGDLQGAWNEVPEPHVGIVQPGADELRSFRPQH